MMAQDGGEVADGRKRDRDASVEPARTQDGGVDPVAIVGGAHQEDSGTPPGAVETLQKSVDHKGPIASIAICELPPIAERVELVDQCDARGSLPSGLEEVAQRLQGRAQMAVAVALPTGERILTTSGKHPLLAPTHSRRNFCRTRLSRQENRLLAR